MNRAPICGEIRMTPRVLPARQIRGHEAVGGDQGVRRRTRLRVVPNGSITRLPGMVAVAESSDGFDAIGQAVRGSVP